MLRIQRRPLPTPTRLTVQRLRRSTPGHVGHVGAAEAGPPERHSFGVDPPASCSRKVSAFRMSRTCSRGIIRERGPDSRRSRDSRKSSRRNGPFRARAVRVGQHLVLAGAETVTDQHRRPPLARQTSLIDVTDQLDSVTEKGDTSRHRPSAPHRPGRKRRRLYRSRVTSAPGSARNPRSTEFRPVLGAALVANASPGKRAPTR